jgi:membrane protein DedA with SNARE-associated domain
VIGHLPSVGQTLAFVEHHGYLLLFAWVLAEQSALPIPSAPLLLAAGALIRAGRLEVFSALACCAIAAMIADGFWFRLGRTRGWRILNLLCRVSLEPDSCVRQTESAFLKYGLRSLLVSKFVPGLNAIAAPLAGASKSPYGRFLIYDAAGAALWSGAYFALGYVFATQLEMLLAYTSTMGSGLLILFAVLLVLWIARKYVQRQLFLRQLKGDRITPEELQARLNAGEDLVIVDLRSRLSGDSAGIPGAMRLPFEDLTARSQEVPRDREIVLFCS